MRGMRGCGRGLDNTEETLGWEKGRSLGVASGCCGSWCSRCTGRPGVYWCHWTDLFSVLPVRATHSDLVRTEANSVEQLTSWHMEGAALVLVAITENAFHLPRDGIRLAINREL